MVQPSECAGWERLGGWQLRVCGCNPEPLPPGLGLIGCSSCWFCVTVLLLDGFRQQRRPLTCLEDPTAAVMFMCTFMCLSGGRGGMWADDGCC